MSRLVSLLDRIRALVGRGEVDAEMDEELRFHLAMETEKNIRKGMDPGEARRHALIAFGGVERFKEKTREERAFRPLEDFLSDLRLAVRALRKSPGFSLVAILSLALGIGANTAIFGIVNALLIRGLPFEAPEELVNLYRDRAQGSFDPMSYPDFLYIQEGTWEVFAELGGYQYANVQRETGASFQTILAEMVTGNYMPLLGVRAALGRTIRPEDHSAPGAHPVVMLGHRYWERAFDRDPGVLGRTIRLSGSSYTIVGVAPESFKGSTRGIGADLFLPIMMVGQLVPLERDPLESRGSNAFFPVGRMGPGASPAPLEAALQRISSDLHDDFPEIWQAGEEIVAVSTREVVFHPAADQLVLSANVLGMILVGLVLLIACTNLTSFLLARALDRRQEVAVRLALGASRGRLVRQFLTETMVLGVLGGITGFLLALWVLQAVVGLTLPSPVPLGLDLSFDWKVPVFTMAVALGAGALVGLIPALQATRPDLAPTLKGSEQAGEGHRALILSRTLVGGQMAVSVILLVAAGLFIRSFGVTRLMDPGWGQEPTALLSFMIPSADYSDEEGRMLIASLRNRVAALPGVLRVGVISNIHLNTVNRMMLEVNADGVPPPEGRSAHQVEFTSVDQGFFDAAGIPLLDGRTFTGDDRADGIPVVVVNEALARHFWPGESALGRTVRVEAPGWPDVTVVGVVGTAKIRTLGEAPTPFIYYPYSQEYNAWVSVLAVSRGDPEVTSREMYRLLRERHPDLIVTASTTVEDHIGIMLILRRLSALLSAAFAVVALGLAVMGLYGVVNHAVARRAKEMGIRISLGAAPGSVVALQLGRGMRLVVMGGLLGMAGAAALARTLETFLLGVSALDPVTFLVAPGLMGVVGLAAAYLPARSASRVNPVEVLKRD
jgi:predicted permease